MVKFSPRRTQNALNQITKTLPKMRLLGKGEGEITILLNPENRDQLSIKILPGNFFG